MSKFTREYFIGFAYLSNNVANDKMTRVWMEKYSILMGKCSTLWISFIVALLALNTFINDESSLSDKLAHIAVHSILTDVQSTPLFTLNFISIVSHHSNDVTS